MHHLYLHVPFCARRCSYCDFAIAVRRRVPAEAYVESIKEELRLVGQGIGPLETIYFGGGTPSLLPPEAIADLLVTLSPYASSPTPSFPTPSGSVEVTLEANPDDVTPASAAAWRRAGVNRVSLGAQSFDEAVLRWMHRTHDAASISGAVQSLREAGIDNISLDLIFALPEELQRDWSRDLEMALALLPSHLSLYGLTVEPRTPLARWVSRGATAPAPDDRYADEYLLAHERLAAAGYHFYEVSNAARPGFESRHNAAYWTGRPYLGLGPSAHSFDGGTRRWNLSAWEAYHRAVSEGRSPIESEELLSAEQRDLEALYLGLRTSAGINTARPVLARPGPSFTACLDNGWLIEDGSRLRCSPEGWLRLDSLVAALTGGAPAL